MDMARGGRVSGDRGYGCGAGKRIDFSDALSRNRRSSPPSNVSGSTPRANTGQERDAACRSTELATYLLMQLV